MRRMDSNHAFIIIIEQNLIGLKIPLSLAGTHSYHLPSYCCGTTDAMRNEPATNKSRTLQAAIIAHLTANHTRPSTVTSQQTLDEPVWKQKKINYYNNVSTFGKTKYASIS